jgi:hypothetical protein
LAILFGGFGRDDGIAMTTNDPDAVCPSVKPYLRTVHERLSQLEAGYASAAGARGEHVVAGFHNASLASDLPLKAASTSLNSHAVVGRVRRLLTTAPSHRLQLFLVRTVRFGVMRTIAWHY